MLSDAPKRSHHPFGRPLDLYRVSFKYPVVLEVQGLLLGFESRYCPSASVDLTRIVSSLFSVR